MTARVNSAEGGTNGVAVTVANSGGLSGDPWDYVNTPAGTTLTFATAAAYKGALGYRATQGSGSGVGSYVRWQIVGWPQVRFRFYFRTSAYPSSNTRLGYVSNSSYIIASVSLTPTGRLLVGDYNGTTVFTSSAPVGLNTWVRVEGAVVAGTTATNGTIRFAWAAGDAAATDTYASTSADTGRTAALARLYVGKLSGTWNAASDFDDIAADDTSSTVFLGASGSGAVVVDPTPPPAAPVPTWPPPAPYSDAIRSGLAIWYAVSASYGGAPVTGASDLRPSGGTITDTTKPGVRRVLNLELPPTPGLFDLLAPIGTTLTVTAHVRYTNREVVDVPMGVFDVDSEKLSEGGGGLSLTAPDRWAKIQRTRFIGPAGSTPQLAVTQQIAALIRGALGPDEPVNITATSTATMGALVWEKDRDKAIIDLANGIGAWVYFDRFGVATIADIPTIGASASWLVDASPSGVLTELDRERSRANTHNVVVVASSATDAAAFPSQVMWDNDPTSPTYAGTDPVVHPEYAGPFGVVPYFFDTPLPLDINGARNAGLTILARTAGLASQVSLGQVPNPAVDAFDVIDVLSPKERYDIPRVLERHVADTVTHPLTVGPSQHIDGRSTRTDEFT